MKVAKLVMSRATEEQSSRNVVTICSAMRQLISASCSARAPLSRRGRVWGGTGGGAAGPRGAPPRGVGPPRPPPPPRAPLQYGENPPPPTTTHPPPPFPPPSPRRCPLSRQSKINLAR